MRYGQAVLDPVRDVKRQRILREIKTLAKPNLSGDQPVVSRCASLRGARLLDQFGDPPCLGPRDRAALLDHDQITLAALVFLVVGVVFLRASDDFSVHRMGDAALDQYRDGLVHLVAEIGRAHVELQSPCNLVCRLLLEKKKKTNILHTSSRDAWSI